MAQYHDASAPRGLAADVSSKIARWRHAYDDWRLYRRTLGELQALSDRELADLGLSRFCLHRVALEGVYGR